MVTPTHMLEIPVEYVDILYMDVLPPELLGKIGGGGCAVPENLPSGNIDRHPTGCQIHDPQSQVQGIQHPMQPHVATLGTGHRNILIAKRSEGKGTMEWSLSRASAGNVR